MSDNHRIQGNRPPVPCKAKRRLRCCCPHSTHRNIFDRRLQRQRPEKPLKPAERERFQYLAPADNCRASVKYTCRCRRRRCRARFISPNEKVGCCLNDDCSCFPLKIISSVFSAATATFSICRSCSKTAGAIEIKTRACRR